jgi:hypothetical protein
MVRIRLSTARLMKDAMGVIPGLFDIGKVIVVAVFLFQQDT